MSERPTLDDAMLLAIEAHRHQRDKAGQPYTLHLLRVMLRLHTEIERITAVLHDLVEDTPYTLNDLRALGYPPEVIAALDCLSKREGETYEDFIGRIEPNPLARRVKLADLEDNMDLRRIPYPTDTDFARLAKYRRAWEHLKTSEG